MNTAQQILDRINSHPNNPITAGLDFEARELELAQLKVDPSSARELSKRLKDKKDITRSCHEPVEIHQSLAQRDELVGNTRSEANSITASDVLIVPGTSSNISCDSDITGISAQHSRPPKTSKLKGIKVMINVQTKLDAQNGDIVKLTAELKRYKRIYEVKAQREDSEWFNDHLKATIDSIREAEAVNCCLGRIHVRGARQVWYKDSFVVGFLEDNVLTKLLISIEGQEFQIVLDAPMSELQKLSYFSNGIWGAIVTPHRVVPTLATAPRTKL